MDTQPNEQLKPSEFIAHYAELVRQREDILGPPTEDGPTFRDMAFLYQAFKWFDKQGDAAPPNEVHALIELISDVRDAWIDPENDPIGSELFPILSEISFQSWKGDG